VNHLFGSSGLTRRVPVQLIAVTSAFAITAGLLAAPAAAIAALPGAQGAISCAAPEPVPFSSVVPSVAASPVEFPKPIPVASPVANASGGQSTEASAAEIERIVRVIGVCQNERRVKTMSRFVSEKFLGDLYAAGGRMTKEQFIELAKDLPRVPVEIVSVSNVQIDAEGRATAEVVSVVSRQLIRATWSFVFEPQDDVDATGTEPSMGTWVPDGVAPLAVEAPADANVVAVKVDEYAYSPDKLRAQGPDIVFSAKNEGSEDHELLVLKLGTGLTTQDLLTAPGPEWPNGVTVIGQVTIPAGTDGQLVLVGMEQGDYVVVDLLLNEDGTPHLALGMQASLTVQ
jgi:hypothetical protein